MEEVYHLLSIIRELAAHPPGAFSNIMKSCTARLVEIDASLVEQPAHHEEEPVHGE